MVFIIESYKEMLKLDFIPQILVFNNISRFGKSIGHTNEYYVCELSKGKYKFKVQV